ncbi:MAG: hypothetical protein H0T42_27055 [Deltaproteobacteria bacterium]|nr:hypothetical protein [Deltaproteobacteria bacterium]
MKRYVTFLIDADGIIAGSISKSPDPRQPDTDHELKVIYSDGRVTVIGRDDKLTRVIAAARWRTGQLDRRTLAKDAPRLSADRWVLIRTCLAKHVDGVTPGALLPEPAKAVREVVSKSPLKLEQPSARFKATVWGIMAAIIAVAAVLSTAATTTTAPPSSSPVIPTPPPPPPPPDEPIEVRIMKAESFKDAFALARPTMTDSAEAFTPGAQLFTTYAASKLRWEDVDVAAETTFGHVLKDAEVERGKRMCADGELLTIQRRDLGPRKIYLGTLRVNPADRIEFIAIGATGELIRGSKARFCGAVAGTVGRTVAMVGMFDLPENRTPIVEQ